MPAALVRRASREVGALDKISAKARDYVQHSKAANTVRAYRADWNDFRSWCKSHRLVPLPATTTTVALYLSDIAADHKTSTVTRRVSAISQAHQIAGHETPTKSSEVRLVLAGIRRTNGTAADAKAPLLVDDLRNILSQLPQGLLGTRDRALLLVGFCGGFRRSELVGLDREDITITRDGLVIVIRKSKTDQEGDGRKLGLPYGTTADTCPVRSVIAWLEASGITNGPLFRPMTRHGKMLVARLSGHAVAKVVKRYAESAGMDASVLAGHSLRSGLATSAAIAGASERSIMNQTGHRSLTMVRRYIRDGSLFRENAAAALGL